MWISKRISVFVVMVAALAAGCQGAGDLFGRSSSQQVQPIASNVNGTGTIQSVDVVPRSQGIGLGTLAGAAVGGIIGSQVGGGSGSTVATAAGAAGGAYVGSEIDKRRRAGQIYKVTIRMDDGTSQSFAQEAAPTIKQGDRVQITNGVLTKL
jgi:outer membrane lipoprotein SlyB